MGPQPSPSPSVGPQPDGCGAAYQIVNQWPGGFQAEVAVTATRALQGWRVTFGFLGTWNGANIAPTPSCAGL